MYLDGVGQTLSDIGTGVSKAAGDHFDKVMSGDLDAIGGTFTGMD